VENSFDRQDLKEKGENHCLISMRVTGFVDLFGCSFSSFSLPKYCHTYA
jgi:hypothetical protein